MNYFDRFKLRMKLGGTSLRDEMRINAKNILNETFDDDLSKTDEVYMWQLGKLKAEDYEDEKQLRIRLFGEKFSTANGCTITFQTMLDTDIEVGDILYLKQDDEFWICTASKKIADIHYQGTLTLCNWILKWQNSKGDILEYPCQDINSTQYNSGEQSNQNFTIGSAQHMITLPADENTIRLASPTRCYLDKNTEFPTVYKVTQNDTTSYNYGKKGLAKVTFYEDIRNHEKDRPDLGICDYIEVKENDNQDNSTDETPVTDMYSEISYTTLNIKCGGSAKTFISHFYNSDKTENTEIIPKWQITCDFVDKLNIIESGNSIKISISDKSHVDETFVLSLTDENDNYYSAITVTIKSLL